MTPTLWPGFSPSWLQPDNFLASKAIWYPAARRRCGSNREASGAQSPWKQEGHPLSPSCSWRSPRQLGTAAKPSPKALRCWAQPPACRVDKTQEASFAACRPGQLQNGQQRVSATCSVQEPTPPHTVPPPPRPATGASPPPHHTGHRLTGKPICTNKVPVKPRSPESHDV